MQKGLKKAIRQIQSGELVVMQTDTIWGILADARNAVAVEKLYAVRGRAIDKPCIILIADSTDIERFFGVEMSHMLKDVVDIVWHDTATSSQKQRQLASVLPKEISAKMDFHRPVSVVLPATGRRFAYLHRGGQTLAFRRPSGDRAHDIKDVLAQTGPVLAPSANLQGMPPAQNITQARAYFGDRAYYLCPSQSHDAHAVMPSHVLQWGDDSWRLLR